MSSGSEFVVVANRLPVHRVRKRGASGWATSPGGLVSALAPILRERGGTWIGWAGTAGAAPRPFEHEGVLNVPVPLSRQELGEYYEGFSNRTLWPLYHDAVRTPEFHRQWWASYVKVNLRFAKAGAAAAADGALVWVQDYHLQLVPAMLRAMRPDLRIGFFLHIPFPPQELFAQLPWRREILDGLLASDVFGCQTRIGATNFGRLARRYMNAEGARGRLVYNGRAVRYREFPISIDFERYARLSARPDVVDRAWRIREGLGRGRKVLLGVDRLDYTKGIEIRLHAFDDLLRRGSISVEQCVFVQTAVPSRESVPEYEAVREEVEQLVGQINGEHGKLGLPAVDYAHRNLPIEELVALYSAVDVMLVTPLRDGMNLVCKEFCASRRDDSGVLVLSEFAGAAQELDGALLVNPHDIDGLAATVLGALEMPADEQARRMRTMRRVVRRNDVFRWSRKFLEALAE